MRLSRNTSAQLTGAGAAIMSTMVGRSLIVSLALSFGSCTSAKTVVIDGNIDCETEFSWSEEGSVPEGTPGFASPELAIAEYLTPFQGNHGGEQQMVGEFVGSLVLEGREVVVAVATDAPGGGWLVLTGRGCEDFDRQ